MSGLKSSKAFAELRDKLVAYHAECKEFEEEKKANRETMTEDEYWLWLDKNGKPEYPLTAGQSSAVHMVANCDSDEPELTGFVWEKDVHDFVETLRQIGVKTFVVTNTSTALMGNIHGFVAEGCTLVGLCTVESDDFWDSTKQGIRFAL